MLLALALAALVVVFGAGWAAGVASAAASAAGAGSSVAAAEGFGVVALRHTYDPGEGAPLHEHPSPRLVVVLSGGTLEVAGPDGSARTVDLAAGQVMLRGPETHALKNVGASTVETIELDLPCTSRTAAEAR
jgi:quercetin dioxygenase-like cupin family protein